MIGDWEPDVIMAWMNRASKVFPANSSALKVTRLGAYPSSLKNYSRTDCIVVNTPDIGKRLRELGWKKLTHVITNFPDQITPIPVERSSLNTPDDAFLVTGSGRQVRKKGFDTLVRAVARIPNAWLWLVGDGPERKNLEKLSNELGIKNRTRFVGWVEHPEQYVAASNCFCMPSRHEPLGNVLLESWNVGVAIVATKSESANWICKDGKDALLVDIDDNVAMAAALTKVRDDAELRDSLIQAGHAKIETKFSKEVIVDQYIDLFHGRL